VLHTSLPYSNTAAVVGAEARARLEAARALLAKHLG
jgi:hypothetical protein